MKTGRCCCAAVWVCSGFSALASSAPSLREEVDRLVELGNVVEVAAQADEPVFLRRAYLDFWGRIPSVTEARAYLEDPSEEKQERLIDGLLDNDQFSRHFALTLDLWLMERLADKHVKEDAWRAFLRDWVAAKRPYDALVREILSRDGAEDELRAAARFYLDREGEPHHLTRDVGRIFFGEDLMCAQCHDDPRVDDYVQRDYYGLNAFFNRTSLFQPDTKKPAALAESAEGEAVFKSAFTELRGVSPPRLPGDRPIVDPPIAAGEEYRVKPDKKDKSIRPIPTYSRRAQLVRRLEERPNQALARNIANRLWAHLMGRGLVEPVDFHHSNNPPTNPELLDLLASAVVTSGYDLRFLLRELALSRTYRRAIELPADLGARASRAKALLPELGGAAERLTEASRESGRLFQERKEAWEDARRAWAAEDDKLGPLEKSRGEKLEARDAAQSAAGEARQRLDAREAIWRSLMEAESKTADAVKLLSEDKELAAAAEQFARRAGEINGEVDQLRIESASAQDALEKAGAALARAEGELAKQRDTVAAEQRNVEASEGAFDDALGQCRLSRAAAKEAVRRLEDAQELVALVEAEREAAESQSLAGGLRAEVMELSREASDQREIADALREAVERIEVALGKLGRDEELGRAAEVLRDRAEATAAMLDSSGEKLTTRQTALGEAETAAGKWTDRVRESVSSLTERWTCSCALGEVAALTPEQLCSSMACASGQLDRFRADAVVEFQKRLQGQAEGNGGESKKDDDKEPLTPEDEEVFVRDYVEDKMAGARRTFVKLYGSQPGQPQDEFFATADQALFLENNGLIRGWLRPSGDNLTGRLLTLERTGDFAEELYLAVLTRAPSGDEVEQVRRYLEARGDDRRSAVEELAWALMSSTEFRFRN